MADKNGTEFTIPAIGDPAITDDTHNVKYTGAHSLRLKPLDTTLLKAKNAFDDVAGTADHPDNQQNADTHDELDQKFQAIKREDSQPMILKPGDSAENYDDPDESRRSEQSKRLQEMRQKARQEEEEAQRLSEERQRAIMEKLQFHVMEGSHLGTWLPPGNRVTTDSEGTVSIKRNLGKSPRNKAEQKLHQKLLEQLVKDAANENMRHTTINTRNKLIEFSFSLTPVSFPAKKQARSPNAQLALQANQLANQLYKKRKIKYPIHFYPDEESAQLALKNEEEQINRNYDDPDTHTREAEFYNRLADELAKELEEVGTSSENKNAGIYGNARHDGEDLPSEKAAKGETPDSGDPQEELKKKDGGMRLRRGQGAPGSRPGGPGGPA